MLWILFVTMIKLSCNFGGVTFITEGDETMSNKYLVIIYRIIIVAFIGTQVVQIDAFNSVTRADDTVTDFELVDDEQLKISANARVDMEKKQIIWDIDAEKKTDEDQLGLEFDDSDATLKKMSGLKINGISKEIAANNQYILGSESERKLDMTFVTELNDENAEKATLKLKPLLMDKSRKINQQKEYDMTVMIPKVADTTNNASNTTNKQSSSSREHKTSSSSSAAKSSSSSEDSDDADADADSDKQQSSKEESKKDDSEEDADKEDDEDVEKAGPTTYTVPRIGGTKSISALAGNIGNWTDPTEGGYTTDDSGKYPTKYWNTADSDDSSKADEDANYRNYIGNAKVEENNEVEGATQYNYLGYGKNGDDGDESAFWLKKYLEPTDKEDTYKVNLNVRGNDYAPLPKIEVVLVLDKSTSMNSSKLTALKKSAINFVKTVWKDEDAQEAVKIGLVEFGTKAKIMGELTEYSEDNIKKLESLINGLSNSGQSQYTFTQDGMKEAYTMLGGGGKDAQKNMIVMSDGEPTRSYTTTETVPNEGASAIQKHGHNVEEFKKGNNSDERRGVAWGDEAIYSNENNPAVSDTNVEPYKTNDGYKVLTNSFSTVSQAIQMKNDTNIYSVMFDTTAPEAEYTMRNIASGGNFYNASKADDLNNAFAHIARGLVRTVSNATITDPMGENINAIKFNPGEDKGDIKVISNKGQTAKEIKDAIEVNVNNNHVSVSGITLGKGEEVQISYEIKINDDAPSGKFIQANGKTTLDPAGDGKQSADFGIPSVRIGKTNSKDAEIPLWKIDEDNELIKNPAKFEIFKSDEDGNQGSSIATVATEDGKLKFTDLDEGYYLIKEAKAPEGFEKVDTEILVKAEWDGRNNKWIITNVNDEEEITDTDPIEVKNILKDFELNFTKVDKDKKELEGAEFELKNSDDKVVDLTVKDATFSAKGLKPGKYTLSETKKPNEDLHTIAPINIEINKDGEIKVVSSDNSEGAFNPIWDLKQEDQKITFDVINTEKEKIDISGEKIWKDNNNQSGERPESIEVQLQRKDSESADWENVDDQNFKTNEKDNWQYTFVGLPQYTDETHKTEWMYQVVEVDTPTGYEASKGEKEYDIVNTIKDYNYEVNKVDSDGDALEGAEFTLVDSDDNEVKLSDDSTNVKFIWNNLAPGAYTLEETKSPDQHHGKNNKYEVFVHNDGTIVTTPITKDAEVKEAKDGSAQIINDVNDFKLNFAKVDEDGKTQLSGAEFTIREVNGDYTEDLEGFGEVGSEFEATNLEAGKTYELTETKAPSGHAVLRDPIRIQIGADGEVTVKGAENVTVTDKGKTSTISFNVKNKNVDTTDFEGSKKWVDDSDKYGDRPDKLTIQLQQRITGTETWHDYETQEIDVENEDLDENVWNFKFTGLPTENTEGREYEYRVKETSIPDNYDEILLDNSTIENRHIHFDYEINKVDANGELLAGAEFKLTDSNDKMVELDSSSTDSKFIWKGLKVGTYTLEETKSPDQHHGENSKFKVTVNKDGSVNTEAITKNVDFKEDEDDLVKIVNNVNDFELNFTKKDENGKETLKGAEFELKDSEGNAVELKESNGNFQTSGLKADSSYVLKETKAPNGYSLLRDPINIKVDAKGKVTVDKAENVDITDNNDVTEISFDVNNQPVENITFKGTKEWDDNNNKYGERPENLTVQLQRRLSDDADWEDYKTQKIDAENVDLDEHIWEFEFTDLPKENNAGQTYQYRVIENDVPNNYEGTLVDDHTIVNKHVQHHFDYEVNKVDANGETLVGAEFKLTDSEGEVVEMDGSSTDSKFVWKELDVGEYTLEETKSPDQHHGVNNKFKVTVNKDGSVNTEAITKNVDFKENTENAVNIVNNVNDFELNFTKKDENGKETLKGAEFELKDSEGNEVELKESDGNFQAAGLKADSSYVLTETRAPSGYSMLRDPVNIKVDAKGKVTVDKAENVKVTDNKDVTEISFDVHNQPVETTTFEGTKEWVDFSNKNDKRPNELEMVLQQKVEGSDDWEDFKTQTVKGSNENSWKVEFTDLPTENEQGKKYDYRLDEVNVPEDYDKELINDNTVQNSYLPGSVVINGEKEWDDDDNGFKLRPESIEFALENYVDGEWKEIETATTNAEDNWKFNFNVEEQESDKYRVVEKTSVDQYKAPVYYDGDGNKIDMSNGFEAKAGTAFSLKAVNAIEADGSIKLNKFDANGKETTDASFQLKHVESGKVVDSKEKFVWDNIIAGDYILLETSTGNGMTVNHKPYEVNVDNDGKVTIKNGDDAIKVNGDNEIDYRNWLSSVSKKAQQSHAQIGDTISWDIQTTLPSSFASFKEFNISDQLNSNLRHAGSDVSLTIQKADGSTSEVKLDNSDYQLLEDNNKVTINLLSADFTGGKDALVSAIKSAGFKGTVTVNWEIKTKVVALDGDNPLRNEAQVDWTDGGGFVDPITDADEVKPAEKPSVPTTGNPWMMIITLIGGALVLLGIWLLKKRSRL